MPEVGLITQAGETVCRGFTRVVIGDRGPYLEFSREQALLDRFSVPKNQQYRLTPAWKDKVYYVEYRTPSGVMIYEQLRTVSYANYKVGMFYVSPWDVELVLVSKAKTTHTPVILSIVNGPKPEEHR
ncbi:MAG: hypothetical protein KKA81_16645 [Bacteroidetes bacterium]|nr:hypothetical protein [Bacteroidota bacterium]